ncbi:MAG: hypothetical protein JWO40_827 [Candidatus Doudnabacteria bacterium]|nr:hypothetical protein [Candidatus Doudnabacteria bacterium]
MQYPVPQFIDIEDKIIGPFTLKQFGFFFGGGILVVVIFKIFQFGIVFILLGVPIALLTLFISFGKFNGKPMYEGIPIFIKFLSAPKVMIFQKERNVDNLNIGPITIEQIQAVTNKQQAASMQVESAQSQLKRLSRLLDQKSTEEEEIINKNNER